MADNSNKEQPGKSNPVSQQIPIPIESIPSKDSSSLIEAVVEANKKIRSASQQPNSDIPRFDLAEDIMAQQRKTSAQKRKSPVTEPEIEPVQPKAKPIDKPTSQVTIKPKADSSDTEEIVQDIVARDIERLCNDAQ